MKKFLFWFAVTGWVLGLTVHLLSLADIDVAGHAPYIWLLHIGIFVVWIPVVIDLQKNSAFTRLPTTGIMAKANPVASLNSMLKNAPRWLRIVAIAGFFYAVVNFLLFLFSQHGDPAMQNGQYVLETHGHLIRTITQQEYYHYKANELRGFSGHWIAFYGMAMAALWPFKTQMDAPSLKQSQNEM